MLNANLDRPVEGKPVLLPTPELLTQKPMKQPDLKARAAAKLKAESERKLKAKAKAQAEQKKNEELDAPPSSLFQSP